MKIRNMINKLIWQFCSMKKRVKIARNIGVNIGNDCVIYRDVSFGSEPYLITIGKNVRITNGVRFITHDGGIWVIRNIKKLHEADIFRKIKVGNNVHIGMNAIIMPGVTIGDNVIIGAGAIVTKDITSNSVAVGIPAKIIESIDDYYQKNIESIENIKYMNNYEKKIYLQNKFNIK